MRSRKKGPSRFWWIYFACYAAAWVLGIAMWLAPTLSLPRIAYVTTLVDTLALVGLFLYIRNVPFLVAGFWRFVFLLLVMKATFGIGSVAHDMLLFPEDRMLPIIFFANLVGLPVIYAVGRYAFGSPHVWRKTESVGA